MIITVILLFNLLLSTAKDNFASIVLLGIMTNKYRIVTSHETALFGIIINTRL